MPSGQARTLRIVTAAWIAAVTALLGLALDLSGWGPGDAWIRTSYDSLHSIGGERDVTADSVVIVYLDTASFRSAGLDSARPWPRELHGNLVRRLTAEGARAVVFDILFAGPGATPGADASLAMAIRDNGRVILATEYANATASPGQGLPRTRTGTLEPLSPEIAQAAAGTGFSSLAIDDDFVVRRSLANFRSLTEESLTWAAARLLDLPVVSQAAPEGLNSHWVRYYGPAMTLPHVSLGQALETNGVPRGFFRNKIVFIGARSATAGFNERKDEFRNPFHSWRYRDYFMPGVEVHATEMMNLLRHDWLSRPSRVVEAFILIAAAGFGGLLALFRPLPGALLAVAGGGLVVGAAAMAFDAGVWFPWLIPAAAQIPAALGLSVLWQSLEWYRTRRRLEADQRAAAAQIREQAELIDKAHDAILVRDFSGRIIHANAGASRLYGWSVEDIRSGRAGPELLSIEPSAAVEALDSTQRNGEWNGELRQRTKSGAVVITASRWTLIRDQTGMPKSLLMIHSDITEKKELEARFLRTQRMNTIGSLAGGMAHDLNNALAPVLMGAELLRRKGGDEESRRTLGLIEAGALRAADMVRQVLLFARGRGGAVERVSPALLVRELEKMLRETFPKSIEIVVFVPGDLGLVRGNTTQLHQVLLNLAVNARDAMPSGGRLTLVADNVSLDAPSAAGIPSAFPGEFVVLGVTDTGTGIAPDVLQRIFEPFFTTKAEGDGTGIGLATVIHIVKAHGGFLRVDSVPGEGSTFEVFLPREPMAADLPETDATAADPRLTGNGELILVVDEERSVRELTSLELVACGYRVATATDPTGALAVLTQPGHPVRLVLLDGSRPGMDVQQTVDALRQIRPGLPVILACGDDAVTPLSLPRLRKPYAVTELLDAVRREMDRSPLATPPPRLV